MINLAFNPDLDMLFIKAGLDWTHPPDVLSLL
jgi:hypothetical protein